MKNIFFSIVLFSLIAISFFIFLEITLPIFDNRGENIWRKELHTKSINIIHSEKYFFSKNFNAELGWDYPLPYTSDEVEYIAESYGASYTESGHSNGATWQQWFYKISDLGIINLGVGGYGLDQSILKFEKHSQKNERKDVKNIILGLNNQVYGRSVSYYSYYYFFNKYFKYAFKPMFIKADNEFELLKIPCIDSECLKDELINLNSVTYANLDKHDYWYKKEIMKPVLKFPRTISYLKAIPSIIHRVKQRKYIEPSYFENEDSIELTKYLILRFFKEANLQNSNPIMLLMYDRFGLEGILKSKREDEWLIKFFKNNKISFIDTSPFFTKYIYGEGDMKELFLPDGHYSTKGDSLVALSIYNNIHKFKF